MAAIAETVLVSLPLVVLVVEVALASPIRSLIQILAAQGGKSARLLRNGHVSDHWKEKVLPNYALAMLKASLLILVWLFLLTVIVAFGACISALIFNNNLEEQIQILQSAEFVLSSFLLAMAYLIARRFVRNG